VGVTYFFERFHKGFALNLSVYLTKLARLTCLTLLSWGSLSWAESPLSTFPLDINTEILLNLSVQELSQAVREVQATDDGFLKNIILNGDFYKTSKHFWLERENYQNLVNFPQYLVLREIKENFNNFEWRKKAVHLLLDAKTQFAEIPAGTFQMGSPESDSLRSDDELQHWVKISYPTSIQRVEFTQLLLVLVTGKNNSKFQEEKYCPEDHLILKTEAGDVSLCPRNPAEKISWNDIAEKDKSGQAKENTVIGILRDAFGINTRLPTEAEWERAARGFSEAYQSYSFGELAEDQTNLKAHAWYYRNSGNRTHRVAVKQPNSFGLFDIHGNVWEWVEDLYSDYSEAPHQNIPLVDPVSQAGSKRVFRGGGWNYYLKSSRSASRGKVSAEARWTNVGFRLVRTP
jgi:formylglycine-generating enzyme required for sulfatase activity